MSYKQTLEQTIKENSYAMVKVKIEGKEEVCYVTGLDCLLENDFMCVNEHDEACRFKYDEIIEFVESGRF